MSKGENHGLTIQSFPEYIYSFISAAGWAPVDSMFEISKTPLVIFMGVRGNQSLMELACINL